MHAERYTVPAATLAACQAAGPPAAGRGRRHHHRAGARVGGRHGRADGRTELFIHRPWTWRVVDVLLTNFHLPRSSLLVLVDAFVGPRWRDLYDEALAEGYRFLSFGDAMLVGLRGDGA